MLRRPPDQAGRGQLGARALAGRPIDGDGLGFALDEDGGNGSKPGSALPPRPVLNRLGDVRGLDGLSIREIGDGIDRKSTRLNSSHSRASRMPSSA